MERSIILKLFGSHKSSIFTRILLLCLVYTVGIGQRYDFNWVFGYSGGVGDPKFGTTLMRFESGNAIINFIPEGRLNFREANASISDQYGNLLFYTNGYDVMDNNHKKIMGATNLGIRYWDGLISNQGVIFLPHVSDTNIYYLIYIYLEKVDSKFIVSSLRFLQINKVKNMVINKGIILSDTINEHCLSVCKHANGRDWWILVNKENTNIFYAILLDNTGFNISLKYKVDFNIIEGYGQSVFSRDGNSYSIIKAINSTSGNLLYYFKFDRCTGYLSDGFQYFLPNSGTAGISFSPNSQFFYYSDGYYLFQIDKKELGPSFNPYPLDTIQKFINQWRSGYDSHMIGPDNKIYISPNPANIILHEIKFPDRPAKFSRPSYNSFYLDRFSIGIPNVPNYRLGPIDGSECDTLGIDNIPWAWWRYDLDTLDYLNFEFIDCSAYEVTEWEWNFGDGHTSKQKEIIHRFEKEGVYEVCLIAKNNNGADTLCRTLNVGTVGTDNNLNSISIELFPNPSADWAYINVLDYLPRNMNLLVIDAFGKEIHHQRLFGGSNYIDALKLPTGIYYAQIWENGVLYKCIKWVKG